MNTNTEVLQDLDELVEAARLLGVTQTKMGFGCHTDEDRRFERAMYESIDKRRAALLAAVDGPDTQAAEIEALRAEVERLRADLAESEEIREKLGHLLTCTAAALKGEPPAGVWHSWHDLPEKAAQLAEALKKVAQSLEWYAHGRCRGFDDDAPLPTSEAVALAERTLAKVRA